MAISYTNLRSVATRLIGENGRTVTLSRISRSDGDPAMPWRGPATDGSQDPTSITVTAVIVPPDNNADQFDSLVRRNSLMALVDSASVEAANATADLTEFDKLIDGTTEYKITAVRNYEPGSLSVMYELELEL